MTVIATSALVLAACAENEGMSMTRSDARPFQEAHSECWVESMNIAGFAATMPQVAAYKACMARYGWADQRTLF